jgi:predicted lipoprotein
VKRRTGLVLTLAAGLLLQGCVGGDDTGSSQRTKVEDFNYVAMMANYADNLIVPQYQEFADLSSDLADTAGPITHYCGAIGTEAETAAHEQAQSAWREAVDSWQQAELFLVGPVAANGAALRNRIYSYASTSSLSSCAVDQAVVLAEDANFDVQQRSFNSRGLDALEYLLFRQDLSHTCPTRVAETADWNDRSAEDRKVARCQYAQTLAQDLADAGQTLVDAWAREGGNYRFEFVDPANQEDNLSALSDALFYIETETKDAKLGIPTGIHSACSQTACPEAVESKYSQTSFSNVRQNLLAFRRSLTGGDGPGFDDIITSAGFPQVVESFQTQVDDALALIDQMDSSLYEQTLALQQSGNTSACANPDSPGEVPACALHGLLKRITDALRTDFVTIVNLDLPDRAQSDND